MSKKINLENPYYLIFKVLSGSQKNEDLVSINEVTYQIAGSFLCFEAIDKFNIKSIMQNYPLIKYSDVFIYSNQEKIIIRNVEDYFEIKK